MNQAILDSIAKHCLELGYEVIDWGDDSSGFYAPTVRKVKNGKEGTFVAVNIYQDGAVYIHDFCGDTSGVYIESSGEATDDLSVAGAKDKVEDFNKRKLELFTEIYKQLKLESPDKKHALFQTKKLVPFGRAIRDSLISYTAGGKKYEFSINSAAAVPFVCGFDEPVCGVQYRDSDCNKKSIKFSRFKRAFHVLSDGSYDRYLGSTLGYLTESFTTACEIAEAMPKAFVACTAGISQQLDVYEYIKEARPDMILINVLDKTKDGFPSDSEKELKRKTRYIQLDVFDPKNNGLTDYNEYALKYGKGAVRQEVYRSTMEIYPKMPEILSYNDGEFKVISAIHGGIETIPSHNISKRLDMVMNNETQKVFCRKSAISIDDIDKGVRKKWIMDANRNISRVPKGKGVFEDGDFLIANMEGARFKINGEVENVVEMMPVTDQLYLNIIGNDLAKKKLTKDEFNEMARCFRDCYGDKSDTLFYSLIGFCVQGMLAGVSPHRAHAWLTGISGSGKTNIKTYMLEPLSKRLGLSTQDATPAGIDQYLAGNDGHNAMLVLLDETGDETTSKRERITGLLTLACETAVSKGLDSKIRGTAGQDHKSYNRTASFVMCSQTHFLSNPQDIARFLVFDISKYDLNRKGLDSWEKKNRELADKFAYTVITSSENFLKFYTEVRNRVIDDYEPSMGMDMSHKVQALSSVLSALAAFWVNIGFFEEDKAVDAVFKKMDDEIKQHLIDHKSMVTNDTTVLDLLLLTPLKIDGIDVTLKDYVSTYQDQDKLWDEYGIKAGREGRVKISITRFKIPLLFKNYSHKKVHISKSKLSDLHKYNSRVKRYSTKTKEGHEWIITIK